MNQLNQMEVLIGIKNGENTTEAIGHQQDREQKENIRLERLPIKCNSQIVDKTYHQALEEMGITIIQKESDEENLFMQVKLPEGWKIQFEGGYWSNLVDNKGRKRGSMFYKAAWYDRDAFFSFTNRFHISYERPDYDESLFKRKPEYIEDGFKRVWEKVTPDSKEYSRYNSDSLDEEMIEYLYEDDALMQFTSNGIFKQVKKPKYKKNPDYVPMTGYEKYSQPFHKEVIDWDGKVLFASEKVKTDFEWKADRHHSFYQNREEKEKIIQNQCENWLNQHYPDWQNPLLNWD